MPTKLGNGGNGQENYDPNTGEYIDSNSQQSSQTTTPKLNLGGINKMGLGALLNKKIQTNETFKNLTMNEYVNMSIECSKNCNRADESVFHNHYKGAGNECFELNKYCRFGLEKYLQSPGNYGLSGAKRFEERKASLDRITHAYAAPENINVYRVIDIGPIVSWFQNSGVLDGLNVEQNDYGYNTIKGTGGYDRRTGIYTFTDDELDDLYQRLSKLKGSVVPFDGGFTSVSCVENATHMGNQYGKQFLIRMKVHKGQTAYFANYNYESEALFPREASYKIDDIKIETVGGKKKVVLYYDRTK